MGETELFTGELFYNFVNELALRPIPEQLPFHFGHSESLEPDEAFAVLQQVSTNLGQKLCFDKGLPPEIGAIRSGKRNLINVNASLPVPNLVHCISHELAHALLHSYVETQIIGKRVRLDHSDGWHALAVQEIEAEYVAVVTARRLGVNSRRLFLPFITHWQKALNSPLPEILLESCPRIQMAVEVFGKEINAVQNLELPSLPTRWEFVSSEME